MNRKTAALAFLAAFAINAAGFSQDQSRRTNSRESGGLFSRLFSRSSDTSNSTDSQSSGRSARPSRTSDSGENEYSDRATRRPRRQRRSSDSEFTGSRSSRRPGRMRRDRGEGRGMREGREGREERMGREEQSGEEGWERRRSRRRDSSERDEQNGDEKEGPKSERSSKRKRVTKDLPAAYTSRDQNGDNQIGLYEWPRADFATFMRLDRNHDGFLVPRELEKASQVASAPQTAMRTP